VYEHQPNAAGGGGEWKNGVYSKTRYAVVKF
jgi:hypothetical protein